MKQLIVLLKHLAAVGRKDFHIDGLSIGETSTGQTFVSLSLTDEVSVDVLFTELGGRGAPPTDTSSRDHTWRAATAYLDEATVFITGPMRARAVGVA